MLISLGISVVMVAILMALSSRTFGNNFLGSATFLSNAGSKAYTLPAASSFFFFVSMLTSSTVVIVMHQPSFIVAIIVALPATFLIATRSLFAWSFDRVIPDKVSEVNERTRSPLVANVIVLIVTLMYLAVIVFAGGGFLKLLYTSGIAEILTSSWWRFAGIVFPYRRRLYVRVLAIAKSIWDSRAYRHRGGVAGRLHTVLRIAVHRRRARRELLCRNPRDVHNRDHRVLVYPISKVLNVGAEASTSGWRSRSCRPNEPVLRRARRRNAPGCSSPPTFTDRSVLSQIAERRRGLRADVLVLGGRRHRQGDRPDRGQTASRTWHAEIYHERV